MLTLLEKVLFAVILVISAFITWLAFVRLRRTIARGQGAPNWAEVPRRAVGALLKAFSFAPVFRGRLLASIFHGLVGWGFSYYLLVNIGDVLQGYISGFDFLGDGLVGDLYRLGADLLSAAVLVGMAALMVRRFVVRPSELTFRDRTLLHPKARQGISRDSAIVGVFILLHVGFRFLGESFHLASQGRDAWQPIASFVAGFWTSWSPSALEVARHVSWWLALGLILAFLPYFLYSKHVHLFFAPLNFALKPERRSIGELYPLDFEDQSIEQFGAARLEDLPWSSLMDAYACIMCNRCQDACPAHETGKVLSPAALEINKRYFLNLEGAQLAAGEASKQTLLEFAIPAEAVWACTACGACVDVCPVGNEPMHDILEMRRNLVLMENDFPELFQTAFRGMERTANPWNIGPEMRMEWAAGLDVPTVAEKPEAELLWWVGCAPATDPRAQKTAQAFARVLNAAGVDFAVLGQEEQCTGDSARRAGNEYLFDELARKNVETLKRVNPKRIVSTCPHCLHTIKNEYPAYGGDFKLVHHTELLQEMVQEGRLSLDQAASGDNMTFHDPCYLGRMNDVYQAPRQVLNAMGIGLTEMPRRLAKSFCCGGGGAQMWKEEEEGDERVSTNRLLEAQSTGVSTLAVGCPFCMIMFEDASKAEAEPMEILDVAEVVARQMGID